MEKKATESETVKLPYNIRENKYRKMAYRSRINHEVSDKTYAQIKEIVFKQKRYLKPDFTAKELAEELGVNARYLSAVINSRFKKNFSCLINELRVKEVITMMSRKKNSGKTIEELGHMAGFTNRQTLYAAFYRFVGITPKNYRVEQEQKNK